MKTAKLKQLSKQQPTNDNITPRQSPRLLDRAQPNSSNSPSTWHTPSEVTPKQNQQLKPKHIHFDENLRFQALAVFLKETS